MRIVTSGLCALLAVLCSGCSSDRELRSNAPLVVASDLENPPFAEIDESGRARGRDVEMMEKVASALKRPIEWRRMPFVELLPAVERGDVDVACATLGITPERARRVLFSVPYFETEIAAIARSGEGEPRSIADLDGKKVAAGAGTTSERAVLLRIPRAIGIFENKDRLPAEERLLAREVDAVVLDAPSADAALARSQGALTRLTGDLGAERYALALPKSRAELLAAINRELVGMKESGQMRALDAQHSLRPRVTSGGSR